MAPKTLLTPRVIQSLSLQMVTKQLGKGYITILDLQKMWYCKHAASKEIRCCPAPFFLHFAALRKGC